MVGIFSRFSISRSGHRRTQSALEGMPVLGPNADVNGAHGIEVAVEFAAVEHPVEPLDENDKPIRCPLSEPNSILNDGRLWKERVSCVHVRRRSELSLKEGEVGASEPETRLKGDRLILPTSLSAPEHNILQLLEECNASGM